MNRPNGLTLKELKEQVDEAVAAGYGDRMILISDDEEGNGYHMVWYDLTTDGELVKMCVSASNGADIGDRDLKDFVILG